MSFIVIRVVTVMLIIKVKPIDISSLDLLML